MWILLQIYPAEHDPETAYFAFVVVKLQNLYFCIESDTHPGYLVIMKTVERQHVETEILH